MHFREVEKFLVKNGVRHSVVTDLIEIFQSKSMWHAHHAKAFSKVGNYPGMVSWLNREKNALSNMALWLGV